MRSALSTAVAPAGERGSRPVLDVQAIRRDFPILHLPVHGRRLIYLDNAATMHKPQAVIDAVVTFYASQNSNIHRGVHHLSQVATRLHEGAREKVRRLLNARQHEEIVFVRGTTEAINLVAASYGGSTLQPGDEVVITAMEHHSNIVPWQMLCERTGAVLRVVPFDDRGQLLMRDFERLLGDRTRIVSVGHVSNALGTVNPVSEIVAMAHHHGAVTVVDGAQAVPHMPVDVQALDCDFYAFSSHKVGGPTGVGVLYGKRTLLEAMPPYQGGGDMIRSVTFEKTTYNDLPYKFEAGTPDIAGAVGLGAAIDYLHGIGFEAIYRHEQEMLAYATEAVSAIPGVRLIGTAERKSGLVSFIVEGIHPHDIGTVLDSRGIAVRTGHHCAQPVMDRFGVPATIRASFALYNSGADVDALVEGLHFASELLA